LLEAVPFLLVFLALCYEAVIVRHWYWQALFWPGLLFAFYVHYLGAYYYPCGFNVLPGNIDRQPERLWDWTNGELARCAADLASRLMPIH